MIQAVIFDFFGVLEQDGQPNRLLFTYIQAKLKPKYKIGVISNSSGSWRESVLSGEQLALFDDIVLSGDLDIAKPYPNIYELSARNLKVEPSECVFIDDTEGHCEGARAVGMHAIRFDDSEQTIKKIENILL